MRQGDGSLQNSTLLNILSYDCSTVAYHSTAIQQPIATILQYIAALSPPSIPTSITCNWSPRACLQRRCRSTSSGTSSSPRPSSAQREAAEPVRGGQSYQQKNNRHSAHKSQSTCGSPPQSLARHPDEDISPGSHGE